MTRFKLVLMLGFVLGWAVGSGRAQELWSRMRSASGDGGGFGDATRTSPMIGGGPSARTEETTTRVASA